MSPFQGENSTPEVKTYPKIKIEGHEGPARVVVSCVAHQGEKPRVHPYNLVSPAVRSSSRNRGCENGVCFHLSKTSFLNVLCADTSGEGVVFLEGGLDNI